jgi:citrate synthase
VTDETAGLTAAEVAARLGVQRQTVYAYVSRGLLPRTVAPDGRTSRFDPADVERLRQGARADTEGELHTLIATRITRVSDDGLLVRGHDLVDLVKERRSFPDVADLLWLAGPDEAWPTTVPQTVENRPATIDDLRIRTALVSQSDPLRHDLSAHAVRSAGRTLLTELIQHVPGHALALDGSLADALWGRLVGAEATAAQRRCLEAAMTLLIDHGLAGSTFAARIAASVRADPYSVVSAGLGVVGGTLHGAASAAVHRLFVEVDATGQPAQAVGDARRRTGMIPGFGHAVYQRQDPRYRALMAMVLDAWGDDARVHHVHRVRDVVNERSDAVPNIDLALGSLTWLSGMHPDAGEVIFAVSRTAGWLAHAMEEYDEPAVRFRPRARWMGGGAGVSR